MQCDSTAPLSAVQAPYHARTPEDAMRALIDAAETARRFLSVVVVQGEAANAARPQVLGMLARAEHDARSVLVSWQPTPADLAGFDLAAEVGR